MTMKFSVLASGSTGNAVYVETEQHRFLIDVGLTGKKTDELFRQINRDPRELSGIFVSHEHVDHVKGVGILSRKYQIPIYANANTWLGMDRMIGEVSSDLKFEFQTNSVKTFADVEVESFGVSHDAREPMFFVIHHAGKKLAIITDTGYVSDRMKSTIRNADVFVFESNHDVNMLRMGGYPWSLQKRILGDKGHVSNEDAAIAMSEVIGDQTKQIYLAHLSRENNFKDLARMTVEQVLQSRDCPVGEQFFLYDTDPDQPTKLTAV